MRSSTLRHHINAHRCGLDLLEHDSEMQMAMKELESYDHEGESGPGRRPREF